MDNEYRFEEVRRQWSKVYGYELTECDVMEIVDSVGGFFEALWKWHCEKPEQNTKETEFDKADKETQGPVRSGPEAADYISCGIWKGIED